ncbi:MAG: hypothetical protein N2253_00820 [Bacteroidia bacterium]|nr:hypothetical protein [Bacteroidia bacterium]MCX7763419.1 hypothetical protein [Bacteroidia bacterium]MDW8057584.1 hypothetical protein [Bacteroidia bacterium]
MKQAEVARSAIWNALGYLLSAVISLAYPILLLKWLGRSAYGIVSYLALLTNQSYLLNLGLGEAMAQYLTVKASQNALEEGKKAIQAALAGVWSISLLLTLAWLFFGVEGLASLLKLGEAEKNLLAQVKLWVPPAVWGIQTGMLLNWIPIALGRFQWAAFNTILQAVWQALFPILLLWGKDKADPITALKAILTGYLLYGLTLWLFVWRVIGKPPLPGKMPLLFSLWKKGIWQGAQVLVGLPYTFAERTFIARWISLELMGLYSVVHYFVSKIIALAQKLVEVLFPVFGSVTDSPTRQSLRLSQTTWLISLVSSISSLWGTALLIGGLRVFSLRLELTERMLLVAAIGGLVTYLPTLPTVTFFQSRGGFRLLFWLSFIIVGIQLASTPIFLAYRLVFFSFILGGVLWMGLFAVSLAQRKVSFALWRRWVMPTYLRLLLLWAVGGGAWIFLPKQLQNGEVIAAILLLGLGLLAIGMDLQGKKNTAKRIFLRQLSQSLRELSERRWRRFLRPKRETALNNRK